MEADKLLGTLRTPLRSIVMRLQGNLRVPEGAVCLVCNGMILDKPEVRELVEEIMAAQELPMSLVVECDCEEKAAKHAAKLLADAGLPADEKGPRRFENFNLVDGGIEAYRSSMDVTHMQGVPKILVLSGSTGTGKSHLAEAACRDLLDQGFSVRYELVSALLDRLRATFHPGSLDEVEDVLQQVNSPELLALDDLGMEKGTDFTAEKLTGIFERRLATGKRLIVTTNKTYDEMRKAFEGIYFRLASRLFDEYSGAVRVVYLTCEDYRISATAKKHDRT